MKRLMLAMLCLLGSAQPTTANEGPLTLMEAMEFCCAPLFGTWQGEGWLTLSDGRKVDVQAEFRISRVFFGTSVLFNMDYTPSNPADGGLAPKSALLIFTPAHWDEPRAVEFYTLRYLSGGAPGSIKDFRAGMLGPTEWSEANESGGKVRYVSTNTGTEWSLAGFCCSGGDEDRMSTSILVRRLGGPGAPSVFDRPQR